jgi:thiol-disulfide isomerase/thioredoxin
MKKLIAIALVANTALAFGQKKGSTHLEVDFADQNAKEISLINPKSGPFKTIKANAEGRFVDDIKLPNTGMYYIKKGEDYKGVFLKKDSDLSMKVLADDKHFEFKGGAAKENTYMYGFHENHGDIEKHEALYSIADDKAFEAQLKVFSDARNKELKEADLDPDFKKGFKNDITGTADYIKYKHNVNKLNNTELPDFEFENYKGGKSKLADFKGKYLYIDLWATWCGPCKEEIPHMKKVEEKYHGKNIEFIGISLDGAKMRKAWQAMIKDKAMGGVQLLSEKAFKDEPYAQKLKVYGIPRFILVGPDGKMIDADAKAPSEQKLTDQLDKLLN